MGPNVPLPRSLVPLPGESLRGLLLRLSHRLGQSPSHILWRTGLGSGVSGGYSRAPNRLLFMLNPSERHRFAEATRLDPATVDRLTLRSYFAVDPAVTEALGRPDGPIRTRTRLATWLMFSNPRYCPQCLAGDESVIQHRHGGTWKLEWHLPIVFACLEHQVFLQNFCPGCQQPHHGPRRDFPRFIASPAVAGLHPSQCRTNLTGYGRGQTCGHRLDSCKSPDMQLTPALQQLQPIMLGLLNHAADPRSGLRRLADLRVMATIVSATWPHSLRGDLPRRLIEELDTHKINLSEPGRGEEYQRARWDVGPTSAPATAAVLSIAVQLLKLPLPDLRSELRTLAEHAPSILDPAWGITWNLLHGEYSATLRHEFREAFTRPSPKYQRSTMLQRSQADYLRRARRQLSIRREYQSEHVPQYLPDDWFNVFIESSSPNRLPQNLGLRRVAAVQLVQIATGMLMPEASAFLGIPVTWLEGHQAKVSPLTNNVLSRSFDITHAFETLVAHIGRISDPVDYRERRERFHAWRLTKDGWDALVGELPGRPWLWSEMTRRACSAIMWSRLTGSEWRLAPDAVPSAVKPEGARQRDLLFERRVTNLSPLGRRGSVWPVLTEYADMLTREV